MVETQTKRPGRNERCHCGSGRKYKQCCLSKDEAADREARAAAPAEGGAAETGADEEKGASDEPQRAARTAQRRQANAQPWKRGAQSARSHQRFTTPRKVGG